jgi:3-hydroxyisobutyrate dehydrogenase-like beta-hydroxyacid dehydrogenase
VSLQIALIGYGEVGQLFAREFVRKGGASVSVYDRKFETPSERAALVKIAAQDDVRLADNPAAATVGADIVISAVTADQAIAAAQAAAPSLKPGQTYIDLNSVSPSSKRNVAAAINPSRAGFLEFAVMSPVAGLGIASPVLAGGARAREWAERLNRLGMKIEAVSDEIGVASATKLCRSIVIKGLEAIMVDLNLAAAEAGVMTAVLASLTASYPGMDWAEAARIMPTRVARHGVRRAAEMREAARMLEEMGLSGAFPAAIADRHERYAKDTVIPAKAGIQGVVELTASASLRADARPR